MATEVVGAPDAAEPEKSGSVKTKVLIGFGVFFALVATVGLLFDSGIVMEAGSKNEAFQPQEEFLLEPWIPITILGIDMSINRAVFYLLIATVLTIGVVLWVASRMKERPGRVQAAIEMAYDVTKIDITEGNIDDDRLARKWFPFLATLFFFIFFSNIIGYLPLPTNTAHPIDIFGISIPSFALYAATANISIALVLTLVVWLAYHYEGVRAKGVFPYLASWLPAGLEDMNPFGKAAIFLIEVVSHFVRLISLSVRLFANILAGHLLLLFMGGGLAVLLGIAALGILTFPLAFAFFIFEVVIVATLQAFIFSILTAIYIGGATAESH
ncbi:MAG: F0F1 ATP synthase subunit A [Solirubrobacterales bacterium]|jgi:F-type H+-transporting ATPase subunit a